MPDGRRGVRPARAGMAGNAGCEARCKKTPERSGALAERSGGHRQNMGEPPACQPCFGP